MAIYLFMGRSGYFSTLGTSAWLAIGGGFALLMVSAALAFNGWPGVDNSSVAQRTVTLGPAAPAPSVAAVALPSSASASRLRRLRDARAARARALHGVKGASRHGSPDLATAAVTPQVEVTPTGVATFADGQPVDAAVDDLQGTVQEAVPPVSKVIDPPADEVQDLASGTADAVDQLLGNY